MSQQNDDEDDGVGSANVTGGGNRYAPGSYLFAVESFIKKPGWKKTCYITQLRILEATSTTNDKNGNPVLPSKVGSTVDCVWNIDHPTAGESAKGNVRGFVHGVLSESGYGLDDVDGDLIKKVRQDSQALRGMVVRGTSFSKEIKSRPGDYYLGMNWKGVKQTEEEVAEMRAGLDNLAASKPAQTADGAMGRQQQAAPPPAEVAKTIEQPKPPPPAAATAKPAGGFLSLLK